MTECKYCGVPLDGLMSVIPKYIFGVKRSTISRRVCNKCAGMAESPKRKRTTRRKVKRKRTTKRKKTKRRKVKRKTKRRKTKRRTTRKKTRKTRKRRRR